MPRTPRPPPAPAIGPPPAAGPLPPRLDTLRVAARRRALLITAALTAPPCLAVIAAALREAGVAAALGAAALCAMPAVGLLRARWRRLDTPWLIRRLNAAVPQFEDSVALLSLAPPGRRPQPTFLAALQSQRLVERLAAAALPDLRPAFPWRTCAGIWLATLLALLAAPRASRLAALTAREMPAAAMGTQRGAALRVELRITPPAYTHLPEQHAASLDATVPAGSAVEFMLRLKSSPSAVALAFEGATSMELQVTNGVWRATRPVPETVLYRLAPAGSSAGIDTALHRLDVIPDLPPEVTVHAPQNTLTAIAKDQTTWDLDFEARDDYGLGRAELSVSLAHSSGDNTTTTQRRWVLDGSGDARHRRYHRTLVLADFGFAKGDDLVVNVAVEDNRTPTPNTARTSSYILRWPAESGSEAEGIAGAVQKITPESLRSERQIIIDSEALIAERSTLTTRKFASRADALGVDQKVLRLRYGQFLGEQFESNAERAPAGLPGAELKGAPPEAGADTGGSPQSVAGSLLAEFGHIHDQPEAATLLDPTVRRILRAALDEMWQAELHLRQAEPDAALPYAYKALDYIKQVQASERIYLARAKRDVPSSDPARWLTGERGMLTDRAAPQARAIASPNPLGAAWQALQSGAAPDLSAVRAWAQAQPSSGAALGLLQAVDGLQHDPRCRSCRALLAARLWSLLPVPPAAVEARPAADAAGDVYLQALGRAAVEVPH